MQCLYPDRKKGHYDQQGNFKFGKSEGLHDISLPCGDCEPCLINKSKIRGFKHFSNTLDGTPSSFITLTYGQYYPITPNGFPTLDKSAVPRFVKRLRSHLHYNDPTYDYIGVCYAAEYGSDNERPHYHLLVYGYNPSDLRPWRISQSGNQLYRSQTLEKLWPYGFVEIGEVTQASATYVASYIHKKTDNKKDYSDRIKEYVVPPKKNYVSGRNYISNNIDYVTQQGCLVDPHGYKINIDSQTMSWIEREFPEHAVKIKLHKESLPYRQTDKQQLKNREITLAAKKELKI